MHFRQAWIEREHALPRRERFGVALLLAQHAGTSVERGHEIGRGSEGAVVGGERFVVTLRAMQRRRAAVQGVDAVRIRGQDAIEHRQGLRFAPEADQREGTVHLRFDVVRREGQRAVQASQRLLVPFEVLQRPAAIGVRLGEVATSSRAAATMPCSGAEARLEGYAADRQGSGLMVIVRSDFARPYNHGDLLHFGLHSPAQTLPTFALYDELRGHTRVLVLGREFFLNNDPNSGPRRRGSSTYGNDLVAGGTGNDWIVGGTGLDALYGDDGDDLVNADDDLRTGGGDNLFPDGDPSYADAPRRAGSPTSS